MICHPAATQKALKRCQKQQKLGSHHVIGLKEKCCWLTKEFRYIFRIIKANSDVWAA